MPTLIHKVLCNVSRRYRAAHVRHIDELPKRIQRKLHDDCSDVDPRCWNSAESFIRDLEQECEAEEYDTKAPIRKAALFA